MRYTGKKKDISYKATLAFFESRGRKASKNSPQTATMYQDKNLSRRRDLLERELVMPLLELCQSDKVLDIGCGYGRWAEALNEKIQSYLGVDFSAELLKLGEANALSGTQFQCLAAQDISHEKLILSPPFNLFLCSGILIYLNDSDVAKLAKRIAEMSTLGARVYLREPMAITGDRLTLDRFRSEELQCDYSAVYRTPCECMDIFGEPLRAAGFECVIQRPLYPKELCNRKETEQQIQFWKREK